MKITIVGAGNVGATTAQRISSFELAREVVIVDVIDGIPFGKALDIYQAAPLVESDCRVIGTTRYDETEGSDIAVITAGMSRRPGMTLDDLLVRNAEIVRGVTQSLVKRSPNCLIIVVSSPLDEMTYVAQHASGLPRHRVIGMAGVLDTARLKTFIAMELKVAVEDVEATVLGGHGEGMVPLIRHTTVAGIPLTQLISPEAIARIVERTRQAGTEIVNFLKTGSAFYAPSAAVTAMIEAIAKDKPRIMPCAIKLDGEYGLKDVVTGVPVKLGRDGVSEIVELDLLDEERESLERSAQKVRENLAKLTL
jgi:malate dehydrogenase